MGKDSTKIISRTGTVGRGGKGRRTQLEPRGPGGRLLDGLSNPSLGVGFFILIGFAAACTVIAIWSRNQPLVDVGRVMDDTRLVRLPLAIEDRAQTLQAREAARQATPRVYLADSTVLDALVSSLENLPRTLETATAIEEVDPGIRAQFGLSSDLLALVKAEAVNGQPSPGWVARVQALTALLRKRPILEKQTWQRGVQEGSHVTVRLLEGGRELPAVLRLELLNIDDRENLTRAMDNLARDAGFTQPLRTMVVHRLVHEPRPTFIYDAATTAQDQNTAAEAVNPVVKSSPPGQIIFQRGDVLTEAQAELFRADLDHFGSHAERWQRTLRNGSIALACSAVALALAGYTVLFCPRIRRNASRMGGVAVILVVSMAVACVGTASTPALWSVATITPSLLVAMLISIAYDRRAALAYALLHGLLVCVALREDVGTMAVMITGIACIVWTLKEIRDRHTLFRTSVAAAVGVGLATVIFGLIERPLLPQVMREIGVDALVAAGGPVLLGGMTLFMLPLIERAFNVTTGMTLIDLRDPKQPLLRELQQRAPGTYNHSLNVAAIAESAAEAIGGNSLLTYVGALYHDVGKMSKPEYFVENQSGGPNKHDKLSPAMSLLIVVGHVKDGIEMAREFGLPAQIQHFIEAHHGTTLVEFFFHRAKQQAMGGPAGQRGKDGAGELDEGYVPDEFEYRYPGPKPRTKEVAILMIADAVESAARTMPEPTPSRIDALVRSIANKRLLDGQFDDCELTLRDLHAIVESVSRTVSSMYHGRVTYPSTSPELIGEVELTQTQPAMESKRA